MSTPEEKTRKQMQNLFEMADALLGGAADQLREGKFEDALGGVEEAAQLVSRLQGLLEKQVDGV